MVHSAAYSSHAYVEFETADTYFDEDRPQIFCPLCGHEVDCSLRFCRSCCRALPSDLMLRQGRLGHTFSSTGVCQKRITGEIREPGALTFSRSKRVIGVDRCFNQLFQLFLGMSLLVITVVAVICFANGKMIF